LKLNKKKINCKNINCKRVNYKDKYLDKACIEIAYQGRQKINKELYCLNTILSSKYTYDANIEKKKTDLKVSF